MKVSTTEPGIQFYTGNFLDGSNQGEGGRRSTSSTGPSALRPSTSPTRSTSRDFPRRSSGRGQVYNQTTIYKFSAEYPVGWAPPTVLGHHFRMVGGAHPYGDNHVETNILRPAWPTSTTGSRPTTLGPKTTFRDSPRERQLGAASAGSSYRQNHCWRTRRSTSSWRRSAGILAKDKRRMRGFGRRWSSSPPSGRRRQRSGHRPLPDRAPDAVLRGDPRRRPSPLDDPHRADPRHSRQDPLASSASRSGRSLGDTFPVGCRHSETIVFPEFFAENPDSRVPEHQTPCGIYAEGCGPDNVHLSWGHDEYLYQVVKDHLPEEGLAMIRYHSFYAGHREGEYTHLMTPSTTIG